MTEAHSPAGGQPDRYLANGISNELHVPGNVPPRDVYRPPQSPEEWEELALASMGVIAELGQTELDRSGRTLDPNQSLLIGALGTARINFHAGETPPGEVTEFEAVPYHQIVKIGPIPRMTEPTPNAPFEAMQANAAKYQREKDEEAEITWTSLELDTITVSRRTEEAIERGRDRTDSIFVPYMELANEVAAGADAESLEALKSLVPDAADREEKHLYQLSQEERVHFCEVVRGVAVAAAVQARRADLVHKLRNIWEPDLDV